MVNKRAERIFCKDCKYYNPTRYGLEEVSYEFCSSPQRPISEFHKKEEYDDPIEGHVIKKEIRIYKHIDMRKQNRNFDCPWYKKK